MCKLTTNGFTNIIMFKLVDCLYWIWWAALKWNISHIMYNTDPLLHTPILMNVFFFLLFFFYWHHATIHHAFQRQLFIITVAIAQFKYLMKLFILHLYTDSVIHHYDGNHHFHRWLTFMLWLFLFSSTFIWVDCIQFLGKYSTIHYAAH